jgi:hypothetical protein
VKVGKSVQKAIDEWEAADPESAMMHACNAIDGTAKKFYPDERGNNARFTRLLRDNYAILGPMGIPGINLVETRFPVKIPRPKAPGGMPDLADVIYGVHRCCHSHGEALPDGFDLSHDAYGPDRYTKTRIERGKVQLSDRIIFGLIGVAVFCPVNVGQSVPDGYYLTFGATHKLIINEWWGRAAEFPAIAATDPIPSVTMDFSEWMADL